MSRTLTIGGADPATFAALGISSAVLKLTHQAADTLTLARARKFEETPLIPAFTRCVLRVDGLVRFVGWCDRDPATANPGESASYVLNGPWRLLDRAPFRVARMEGEEIVRDGSGRITLGRELGEDLTLREQLIRILDDAVEKSGDAFAYSIPEGLMDYLAVREVRTDDYHGTLVRAVLGSAPGVVMRWAYDVLGKPTLHFADSAAGEPTQTLTAEDLQSVSIERATHLLARTVQVVYERGDEPPEVHTIEPAEDALELGADRDVVYSFDVAGATVPGLPFAQALAAWAHRLHVSATPFLRSADWARVPGEQWGFDGKFSRLAGLRSTCQEITRDLFARTEQITLGVPPAPAFLSKRVRDSGPEGQEDEPAGTATVRIYGLPGALTEGAAWTVGGEAGSGDDVVTLPPGEYTAVFEFVLNAASGKLYIAPPKSFTVEEDGNVFVDGDYEVFEATAAQPFALKDISDSGGLKLCVLPSTAFETVLEIEVIAASSGGVVWVSVPFTPSTGEVGACTINSGSAAPASSDSNYIILIGEWYVEGGALVAWNYRYGPISGYACRDWYADPASHTLTVL